jgi:hypothetical protein
MKKIIQILLLILVVITFICGFSQTAKAEIPPDIIHSYTITIDPQTDGSLLIKYELDYEATTDFPSDIQYLQIGVPNTDFEVVDFAPKDFIVQAKEIKAGTSQVQLDFYKLPLKGDRFTISFTIKQRSMAYSTDDGNICFQFIPGWFDFAEITELREIINLENLNVVSTDPETSIESGKMVFVVNNMEANEKAPAITVIATKDSYPNLNEDDLVTKNQATGGIGIGGAILIIILVVVVIMIIAAAASGGGDGGYGGGGYFGGYGGSSSGRSGGGDGGFSGRGSSCACVSSCACACACAGGGRVGCSERGLQVTHWLQEHNPDGENDEKK